MKLTLAGNLVLDLNQPPFNTEGLIAFVCGKTGSGKSYSILKMMEEAYKQKLQFVFLDPHGEGHVLADEKFAKRGDVVVVSERYGIPVTIEAISVYIDIIKSGKNMVIDLSKIFKKEKKRFSEFVEQFIRYFDAEWSDVRTPILLVMDEAHFFAPQKIRKGDSSAASRVDLIIDLATGGRKNGINQIYSTQRPALLDKTPITQSNFRLFGKIEASQDWTAIKDHVKDTIIGYSDDEKKTPIHLTLKDMKAFNSGTFVSSISGDSKIVQIGLRETQDAGMTPSYKATLSKSSQVDMKEMTRRIAEAIESARAGTEKAKEDADLLRQQSREIKRLQEELREQRIAGRAADIVAQEMGITPNAGVVIVPPDMKDAVEKIRRELKQEFDKDLKELGRLHQNTIEEKDREKEALRKEKDAEIADLRKKNEGGAFAIERILKFRDSFADLLGPSDMFDNVTSAIPVSSNIIDYDAIVARVKSEIGTSVGSTYTVEPLKALELDWQRKRLDEMIGVVSDLGEEELKVLEYLRIVNKTLTVTAIAKALYHSTGSNFRTKISTTALKPLKERFLVAETKNGYKHTIPEFIKHYIGETDDYVPFEEHLIDALGKRVNE